MKSLSEAFKEHIGREVTTLCRCWIIETVNFEKLGFTDHDVDIEVDGVLCERGAGMETSAIEEQLGLNSNSAEVTGALVSEHISQERISSGFFDSARVSTYLVNWQDAREYCLDQVMLVGDIVLEDGVFRMELLGQFAQLEQTQGRHFVKRCQADLGDNRCRVNVATEAFSVSGTVSHSNGKTSFVASGLGDYATGWFEAGQLIWVSGENSGQSIQVLGHAGSGDVAEISLWRPAAHPVKEGDSFTITAGCNKDFGTCKDKFSNHRNFQGFPHMPGNSFAVNYANNFSNNDGSPIIP